ncbi:nucleic acid/nucleotide deaminase domain-containing protein [Streptomyces sp. NPDC055060]
MAVARAPGWDDPRTGDLVIGFSKGSGYHAENHIIERLEARNIKPTQVKGLYTDRQPCSVCGRLLEDSLSPGTPISWAVPWGDDVALKAASNEMLKEMIQAAG